MQIRNPSEITTNKPYGEDRINNELFMSREIYNHLKSILENENTKITNTSYGEFLKDMSILHDEIINNLYTEDYPQILVDIDMYLGSLGIDNEYPIKSDSNMNQKKINAKYNIDKGNDNG